MIFLNHDQKNYMIRIIFNFAVLENKTKHFIKEQLMKLIKYSKTLNPIFKPKTVQKGIKKV